ncbi:MAG: MBL fold metallo-hydrolase [Hyphomonas sp.]|nr:MBL fold metallo-hydrolase [Hyphomonas sp.]
MLRPEFPNSAFVSAPERLILRGGSWASLKIPVRYGLFDHPSAGRCLIDTGYSSRVMTGRRSLAMRLYASILNPRLTAKALPGAAPKVDTILLSHLHADHVSALKDYPDAAIHADGDGVDYFLSCGARKRLEKGCFLELLPEDFRARVRPFQDNPSVDAPLGLGKAWDVFADGSVLAVPLPGHMRGHTGFLFTGGEAPLLYAADADWLRTAIMEARAPGFPATMILDNPHAARQTDDRIRAFVEAGGRLVLCHDPEPVA